MKRALTLVMALCMIVSAFAAFGCVNASADSHFVHLYYQDTYGSKYGCTGRYIYVQTDGNAYNQQVTVHYACANAKGWFDEDAEYVTTLSDGSKIWKANVRHYDGSEYAAEYAIKYVADGATYWDNNNGNNYYGPETSLGTAPIKVVRPDYYYSFGTTIYVNLQNYAYNKNVFIRYTNDNWNSYTDVPMSYDSTRDDGTEYWKGTVQVTSSDSFKYCVCYQVNGQEYWANNFGKNYSSYFTFHPYVYFVDYD